MQALAFVIDDCQNAVRGMQIDAGLHCHGRRLLSLVSRARLGFHPVDGTASAGGGDLSFQV
jgi:hypothetical protein